MKFLQHGLDQVRRVHRHIDSGRECSLAATDDYDRNFFALLQLLQRLQQLVHHLEIDHIERWMCERDAGQLAADFDG